MHYFPLKMEQFGRGHFFLKHSSVAFNGGLRTTPGTLIYRSVATVYLALCFAGCAFPRTSQWYEPASRVGLPQVPGQDVYMGGGLS